MIPTGAKKGDKLDLEISLPPNSRTTSLRGGYLRKCSLFNYDSTALRFDAAAQMNDQALRATNPAPGRLRFAGASPSGFSGGRLASYKFVVLRADGARTLSLDVDEIHMVTRVDAKSNLTVAPVRMTPR